jgi:hypothetical protein
MLPALVGAMCAITWHWFDNDPALNWVVTAQASLTLLGFVLAGGMVNCPSLLLNCVT